MAASRPGSRASSSPRWQRLGWLAWVRGQKQVRVRLKEGGWESWSQRIPPISAGLRTCRIAYGIAHGITHGMHMECHMGRFVPTLHGCGITCALPQIGLAPAGWGARGGSRGLRAWCWGPLPIRISAHFGGLCGFCLVASCFVEVRMSASLDSITDMVAWRGNRLLSFGGLMVSRTYCGLPLSDSCCAGRVMLNSSVMSARHQRAGRVGRRAILDLDWSTPGRP